MGKITLELNEYELVLLASVAGSMSCLTKVYTEAVSQLLELGLEHDDFEDLSVNAFVRGTDKLSYTYFDFHAMQNATLTRLDQVSEGKKAQKLKRIKDLENDYKEVEEVWLDYKEQKKALEAKIRKIVRQLHTMENLEKKYSAIRLEIRDKDMILNNLRNDANNIQKDIMALKK